MKAITSGENSDGGGGIYCPSSRSAAASTKVTKHRRDVENEEIRAYLSKLKELVPCMPKNRRLSKLEVIQYVIDYICDLQHALETHPSVSSVAVHSAAAAAVMLSAAASQGAGVNLQSMLGEVTAPQHRQPLAILAPNANANLQTGNHNNTRTCSGSVSVSESPSPSSASSSAPLTISSSSCDGSGSDSR